jgi:hypothetical protein
VLAGGVLAGAVLAAGAPGVVGDPSGVGEHGTAGWSQPATVGGCPGSEAPWAVFPSDNPRQSTGPGAIVWSTGRRCPGGERVLVAAIGADGAPGAPASPRTPAGQTIAMRGPLAVAGAPHGRIVIAAGAPSARGVAAAGSTPGGLFTQGVATGSFSPALLSGGPSAPTGMSSASLGDVAMASPAGDGGGRSGVLVRLERHHASAFAGPQRVGAGRGPVESTRVALDYRSDALVVWWQQGAIYARDLPTSGRVHPVQRLAAAGPHPRIAALISDDNRAIVAWADEDAGETSVFLDFSAPGVRFQRPRLLERFADPAGLSSPTDSPSLIRLSSESVMMAWSGSEAGHWAIRTAPIDLNGLQNVSTIPTPNLDALLAGLAPGPNGDAVVLWTEPQRTAQGIANPASQAIFAARGIDTRPGMSIFGAPEEVAGPGDNSDPTVAIDPGSDRAIAVWRGAGGTIEYALRGPAAP